MVNFFIKSFDFLLKTNYKYAGYNCNLHYLNLKHSYKSSLVGFGLGLVQ